LRYRIFSFLIPTLLWCALAGVGVSYSVQAAAEKIITAKQGGVFYLTVVAEGNPASVQGRLHDRVIPFFKTGPAGEYGALVGIDMADEPATVSLKAAITYPDGRQERMYRVVVQAEEFRVQSMTLPKDQVEPDAAALKRINLEKEKVQVVLASFTPERLWNASFLVPVEGTATGAFGSKRILNGQPRNQHSGEDIAAPLGAPVRAANEGIVRMVDDQFFSGISVILDHGLGLFTMYYHLDSATVKDGARVKRGDVIGTVGHSGRATGPHLHWAAWLNGSRVNPFALTRLSFGPP
ncbi:MAG: hypothetical protein AUH96_04070, partial [Nitrospirae bacterium 13_2_20CM_2_61_4]